MIFEEDSDNEILEIALDTISVYDGYNMSVHEFLVQCEEAIAIVDNHLESILVKFIKSIKLKGEAREAVSHEQFTSYLAFKIYLLDLFQSGENILQLLGKVSTLYQFENERVFSFANRIKFIGRQIIDKALCENKLNNDFKDYIEKTLKSSFIFGLSPDINIVVRNKSFNNLHEATIVAVKIEKYIDNLRKVTGSKEKYLISANDYDSIIKPRVSSIDVNKQTLNNDLEENIDNVDHVSNSCNDISIRSKVEDLAVDNNSVVTSLIQIELTENNENSRNISIADSDELIILEKKNHVISDLNNEKIQVENSKSKEILKGVITLEKLQPSLIVSSENKVTLEKYHTKSEKDFHNVFSTYDQTYLFCFMLKLIDTYKVMSVLQNTLKHSSNLEINPILNLMPIHCKLEQIDVF